MLYQMALTFESVHEILKCDHSNKDCWTVLFCNAVYLTIIPQVRMGSEYWLRGERSNCFSKIQLAGQKYRDKTILAV